MTDARPERLPRDLPKTLRFIITVGTLASQCGVSSTHVRSMARRLGKALGVDIECFLSTSHVLFLFNTSKESAQQGHVAPLGSVDFDLGRLGELTELVEKLEDGTLDIDQAEASLDAIASEDVRSGNLVLALGYTLSGAAFAMLFNGSWATIGLGAFLSAVLFAITQLSLRWNWLSQSLDLSAAFVLGVMSGLAAALTPDIDPVVALLAGVVVIIPGYTLTLAVAELTNGSTLGGLQRLVAGVLSTAKLFLGGWAGVTVGQALLGRAGPVTASDQPDIVLWAGAALVAFSLGLVFRAQTRDLTWIVLGGLLAYAGTVIGESAGNWQGPFLGSLFIGFLATAFWHFKRRPPSTITLTAVMILVPGASAILGVNMARSMGLQAGLAAEWQAFVVIVAIIAGQVVANTLTFDKLDA